MLDAAKKFKKDRLNAEKLKNDRLNAEKKSAIHARCKYDAKANSEIRTQKSVKERFCTTLVIMAHIFL